MGTFDEKNTQSYDWDKDGVYVIEPTDYVEGGEDGVSNRQAKQLTKRTRNLHDRVKTVEQVTTTHGNDAVRHITAVERTAWNAKETPTGAQTKATTAKNEAITTAATDASTKSAAVLNDAKSYIDTEVAKVSNTVTTHGKDAVRHITAIERPAWNAKETPTGAQIKATTAKNEAITTAATDASTKSAAVLQSAKEYANGKDTTLRNDMATADTATLRSAKTYADTIVAALVDNSPEALNTLQELAKALGNDPNFATTVMNEIGKRVSTTDFDTALAGKLNQSAPYANGQISVGDLGNRWGYMRCEYPSINTTKLFLGSTYGYATPKDAAYIFNGTFNFLTTPNVGENQMWHAGNLAPASTEIVANTLAQRDGAGYLSAKIFKDDWIIENQPIGAVGYKISQADGYHRFCFPDHFKAQLGLWSTSNFDPATKADKTTIDTALADKADKTSSFIKDVEGWRAIKDCNDMTSPGTYDIYAGEVSFQNAPFETYGQICVFRTRVAIGQLAFEYNNGNLYVRTKYNTTTWSQWQKVHHAGNLVPATRSTNGLMSADDKAKLDSFIRGSVNADGSWRGTGFEAYKQGNYLYVRHSLGHINYMAVATVNGSSNGSAQDNEVAIISKTSDAVGFLITNGVSGDPEIAAFDFIIMSYW